VSRATPPRAAAPDRGDRQARPAPPGAGERAPAAPGNGPGDVFRRLAHRTSNAVGTPAAFLGAASIIVVWGATGPLFHFSDTWQLVINTGTTIVTFLMVFLIQNAQNRDARAIHLKLDELLRAVEGARTGMVNLEALSDDELLRLQDEFERLQKDFGVEPREAGHVETVLAARAREGHQAPRRGRGASPP
jgi:low affinity Fe/Cu permease